MPPSKGPPCAPICCGIDVSGSSMRACASAVGRFDRSVLLSPSRLRARARQTSVKCPTSPAQVQLSFAPVVKRAAPAVVNVYAVARGRAARDPLLQRSVLPPVLRRPAAAARARAAVARLRRHRRSDGPDRHQLPRHRGRRARSRSRSPTSANSTPRSCSRTSAPISPCCGIEGRERDFPVARLRQFRRVCRSATWCWRSAIRSASARP